METLQEAPESRAITGPHPLVGDDKTKEPFTSRQGEGPLYKIDIKVGGRDKSLITGGIIRFIITQRFLADIRRIANYGIKSAALHDLGKLRFPIKRVDPTAFVVVDLERQGQRARAGFSAADHVPIVGADERVSAFDVVVQPGQNRDLHQKCRVDIVQELEIKGHPGHFASLGIDVHAKDVVDENAAFELGRKMPAARGAILPAFRPKATRDFLGMSIVILLMPGDEALKCAQKKRS